MREYTPQKTTEIGAKKIVNNICNVNRFCLVYVGTGGGKTYMSIKAAGIMNKNIHLMIFSYKKKVDENDWQESIESYNKVTDSNITYTIANYEKLIIDKHFKRLKNELNKHQNVLLILDEVQVMRNSSGKKFRELRKLMNNTPIKATIGLTGTPVGNSYLDSVGYLVLAGYYRSKSQFIQLHVKYFNEYHQPIVKGLDGKIYPYLFENYEYIVQAMDKIQVRIDTDKLKPPTKLVEITFPFDKKTQKQYNKIRRDYLKGVYESSAEAIKYQREFVAEHSLERLNYLSQIINSPKRDKSPMLIFYQYNIEKDNLLPYLEKNHSDYELKVINGQSKYTPEKNIPEKTLFICQYQAAGTGLDIPTARTTVFFTPAMSWFDFTQAKGRNVRAFTKDLITQVRFVVPKTINSHYWYDLIDKKQEFTDLVKQQWLALEEQ